MPVIKSAKKKLRQDKKRQAKNITVKEALKKAIKKARRNPAQSLVKQAVVLADKAAKNHVIHKNKAARIKSSLAKLMNKTASKPAIATTPKAKPKAPLKKTPSLSLL